ncbi:hypothetical protein OS493_013369 [Desmophyllum pertusum]|uniref:Uncharacterized protein n=1 Tax=Desmophyllum pertusum TaxID=174260 RepID=A0A9X0CFL8_9CNID|nr:hypothetical protein OS493_013369 [Desmophyllum pertusum]
MLVVISPLNSLIADQISSCERMGIKACKVDMESTISLQKGCELPTVVREPRGELPDKKGEKPFRESYGRIGHLRGFTRAPFCV